MNLKELLKFDQLLMALTIAIICLFFTITLLSPIVFDSDHFSDTIFILGSAWRSYNGLIPSVDFGHFYGGAVSTIISLAFKAFGVSVKAIDYAQVLMFLFFGVFIAYLRFINLSIITVIMLLLLVATLVFTRFPLEMGQSITGVHSTHSFFYNRFGMAAITILMVICSFKPDDLKFECLAGVLIGVLLVFISYLKASFIVLVPATIFALIVQSRFLALLMSILCAICILVVMGPAAEAFIASYDYTMLSLGQQRESSLLFVVQKAAQLVVVHPFTLFMCMSVLVMLFDNRYLIWKSVIAVLLILGAGFAASATMGHAVNLGQMSIPLFIAFIVVGYEHSVKHANKNEYIIKIILTCLILSFSLPHLANSMASSFVAALKREYLAFDEGVLKGYLSTPSQRRFFEKNATQYEMLYEGFEVLNNIEGIQKFGIISDNLTSFEFAMQSKPVVGFPLWANNRSPEFSQHADIASSADIAMIAYHPDLPGGRNGVGHIMLKKIKSDFFLCMQTENWDVYIRQQLQLSICNEPVTR